MTIQQLEDIVREGFDVSRGIGYGLPANSQRFSLSIPVEYVPINEAAILAFLAGGNDVTITNPARRPWGRRRKKW